MIAETIRPEDPEQGACSLSMRWKIDLRLATALVRVAADLPFPLQIISGHRSIEHQEELIRDGKGAPVDLSNHVRCPSTAADVWPLQHPAPQIKMEIGRVARLHGLRWGGGSPKDPETGIPSDWNHFDLGPRHGS